MTSGSELSRIDQEILRYAASRSPEEISEKFNGAIEPARVAALTKELLARRDWLTMAEREVMLIIRLENILNDLERVRTDGDLNYENAKTQLGYLKELGNRFDKRRAATQVDLNALYSNQAQLMLKAIDLATAYLRGAFREKIDQQAWDEAIAEGMRLAAAELEKHQAVEQ
jgi:hypothetical protein